MSAGSDDLYALLGVSSDATWPEIRQRYLEMVERYHPDRHQGNPLGELAAERLKQVNRAYAVLCDPARRAEYDVHSGRGGGQPATGSWREGGEPPQPQDRLSAPRALRWLGLLLLVVLAVRVIPIIARAMARLFGSGAWMAAAGVTLAAGVAGLMLWRRSWRARRG